MRAMTAIMDQNPKQIKPNPTKIKPNPKQIKPNPAKIKSNPNQIKIKIKSKSSQIQIKAKSKSKHTKSLGREILGNPEQGSPRTSFVPRATGTLWRETLGQRAPRPSPYVPRGPPLSGRAAARTFPRNYEGSPRIYYRFSRFYHGFPRISYSFILAFLGFPRISIRILSCFRFDFDSI